MLLLVAVPEDVCDHPRDWVPDGAEGVGLADHAGVLPVGPAQGGRRGRDQPLVDQPVPAPLEYVQVPGVDTALE